MRKNTTMRLAAILLALTLITTCFVGGTFAKYTTSSTGTDKARVAYWGFNAPASLEIDLFDTVYDEVGDEEVVSAGEKDGFANVIAPGTSKTDTFAFGYTTYKTDVIEKPEVDYQFTVNAEITGNHDSLDANPSFYWTLKAPAAADPTKYQTVAELIAAIKALSGDASGSKKYEADSLPDAFTAAGEVYTIGWVWDYEGNDAKDTAMGNALDLTGNLEDLENVTLTITITATQIGD